MSAKSELIHAIFTTALEGGIGYWSECHSYHWSNGDGTDDLNGFFAVVEVDDIDSLPVHPAVDRPVIEMLDDQFGIEKRTLLVIDKQVLLRGYDLASRRTEQENHHAWQCGCGRPPMVVTTASADEWDFDSLDADAIVQLGLFGKVIFG